MDSVEKNRLISNVKYDFKKLEEVLTEEEFDELVQDLIFDKYELNIKLGNN
jgi:hypothetical protein